jgi:hypothetical protein
MVGAGEVKDGDGKDMARLPEAYQIGASIDKHG